MKRLVFFLGMLLSGFMVYNSFNLHYRLFITESISTGDSGYFVVVAFLGIVGVIACFFQTFFD